MLDILNFIAIHYIVSIIIIIITMNYFYGLVIGAIRSFTGKYPPSDDILEIDGDGNTVIIERFNNEKKS